jgi:hypothetical protein
MEFISPWNKARLMCDTSTRVFTVVMDRFKLHAVVQQVHVQSQRTFEFQVQLQSWNSHLCGGAILSDNLVVTALFSWTLIKNLENRKYLGTLKNQTIFTTRSTLNEGDIAKISRKYFTFPAPPNKKILKCITPCNRVFLKRLIIAHSVDTLLHFIRPKVSLLCSQASHLSLYCAARSCSRRRVPSFLH